VLFAYIWASIPASMLLSKDSSNGYLWGIIGTTIFLFIYFIIGNPTKHDETILRIISFFILAFLIIMGFFSYLMK
jgi:hypothetical protein